MEDVDKNTDRKENQDRTKKKRKQVQYVIVLHESANASC